MAPRSNWKGFLKLSLVSAAIAIYPATSSSERVRFNTLNMATGNRLRRQMVDSVTGDVVETEDQVRGYAVSKDAYVIVEDEELDEIALESSHTIDVAKFVAKETIDDRYRDAPYYIAPTDKVGEEAFAVIRDGMRNKEMVGIARVVMARRERVMMIEPFGKGLLGTTLHYAYEIRGEEAVFDEIPDIKLPEQMTGLAETIIDKMSGTFDASEFKDRYEEAVVALIQSKQTGTPLKIAHAPPRGGNVVNLMDALRRSIETSKPAGKNAPARRAAAREHAREPAREPRRKRSKSR